VGLPVLFFFLLHRILFVFQLLHLLLDVDLCLLVLFCEY
jgi:hypothetical protein